MIDELDDSEVENVYPVEYVVEGLKEDLKDGLSEKGTVDISDFSVSVE